MGAEDVRWRRTKRRRRVEKEKEKVGELDKEYMLKGGGLERGGL